MVALAKELVDNVLAQVRIVFDEVRYLQGGQQGQLSAGWVHGHRMMRWDNQRGQGGQLAGVRV